MESNHQNENLDQQYVLIVGDIMLDEYVIGTHSRQSPEADVPIILSQQVDYRLGGAGNVAVNLKSLGLSTGIISVVGTDVQASVIHSLLGENAIDAHLISDESRPTTVKQRIVNQDFEQYLRIDTETTDQITLSQETEVILKIKNLLSLQRIAAIIIQDYNKGVLTDYVIKHIQELTLHHNIPTFVDPKQRQFKLLSKCSFFKPNLKELSLASKVEIVPEIKSIKQAIETLDLDCENIFVTLGNKGIYYEELSTDNHGIVKGKPVDNADVSGAGDTVIASLVWGYLSGFSIEKMAKKANDSGAAVCRKLGVSPIFLKEL